jgi:pullulanase
MPVDLETYREKNFVLWIPSGGQAPALTPQLILGKWNSNAQQFKELVKKDLSSTSGVTDLWAISYSSVADAIRKADPTAVSGPYVYWFFVQDTSPANLGPMHVTDPLSYALDYRVVKQPDRQPGSVIWIDFDQQKLLPCDPQTDHPAGDPDELPPLSQMPVNNQLVIYETPTSFIKGSTDGTSTDETDVGTFQDVAALLQTTPGVTSSGAPQVNGQPYLKVLGTNALELTPPADSKPPEDESRSRQEWGYATAHYFAPDYQLGYKDDKSTAIESLKNLIKTCHRNGVRFFADVVMAFGHDSYKHIAYSQFHLNPKAEPDNPDSYQSSRPRDRDHMRNGWGGESWRYIKSTKTYDPVTGEDGANVSPASSFHLAHLRHWIKYFQIDGARLDSIENVADWDFLSRYRDYGHKLFGERYPNNPNEGEKKSRFHVVGEELGTPQDLLSSGTLDGYWNEEFKKRLRSAILGQTYGGDNFDWTIRKIVDPRALERHFKTGTQAVNYITSHDTGGDAVNQRLYNYLDANRVWEKKQRAKLGFAILLTSIGIPMIYAGEEFCDKMDRAAVHPYKQVDPVNYNRLNDSWRKELFFEVSRLVALRKRSAALGSDTVNFIHWDHSGNRQIVAWTRGGEDGLPVLVVANFSDVKPEGEKYEVTGWQNLPSKKDEKTVKWREVTQGSEGSLGRSVPADWIGREPLFPWEAKVYESYVD